ncbi:twin-arginine translocation protein, TatB subunit [Pseudonocardia dioxanivorans CB1190]|uniref:Twin-arginine translocation protein, TatB subunit n=1 Tax=Pseudonocardia dioxanivorans (strain ATCC 55486 / DSM 44775 / JCM 13855 / CB1190) TaxID=675635 RepID=F4CLY5_PSEUX|nr:twin-arginine translocase TatA/TatE family subunit [Pseudonocardia dioxanivorans]AEA22333.1 twin-arginine translocation protein, TatB subunit [Pseudonocardia dioxanivorans CB1190]
MFGLSVEKLFVLGVVALFVLGPERLPAAAAWVGQAVRKVKTFGEDAQQKLHDELGPEFEQIREPLAQLRAPLQELRSLGDPRTAAMRYLFSSPASPAAPPRAASHSQPTASPPGGVDRPTPGDVHGVGSGPPLFDPDAT